MDPCLLLIFISGFIGGTGAFFIGAPMPYMLGGIFGAACFVLWYERGGRKLPQVTRWVRLVFMSMIGAMIGSRFSPDILALLPQFWISALMLLPFILIAHAGSYAIMRWGGKYDSRDAYFASLPGGIIDSVVLAEKAGADLRIVTAQHFTRIILVVTSVPLLFLFVEGEVVGSLAGESLATSSYQLSDVGLILAIAAVGLGIGHLARLPVAHMVGPLTVAFVLTVSGTVTINVPHWMGHVAQFMIGTALGAQFSGMSRQLLIKGLGFGLIVGLYMLAVGSTIAWVLTDYVPAGFDVMFVSFAAGGLAEMSLIALSLNFNPVVVAMHHLIRIVLTIAVGSFLARRLFRL